MASGDRDGMCIGGVDNAPLMVGQSIGLINDIPSCQDLLDTMTKEAVETLNKSHGLIAE